MKIIQYCISSVVIMTFRCYFVPRCFYCLLCMLNDREAGIQDTARHLIELLNGQFLDNSPRIVLSQYFPKI